MYVVGITTYMIFYDLIESRFAITLCTWSLLFVTSA